MILGDFVETEILGAHTQTIERTWRSAKKRNKKTAVLIVRCWIVICVSFCGEVMLKEEKLMLLKKS